MYKKQISDLTITANEQINSQYFRLRLKADKPLPEMHAGQFVEVLVENSKTTFLRRPFSIHYWDRENNEFWLLIQKVGDGTRQLSECKVGETLNVIFPLGNSYSSPLQTQQNILLIGGGAGSAPMLMLGSELHRLGFKPTFLLGARTKADLMELDRFVQLGDLHTTTEDGSCGDCKGYITNHPLLMTQKFDKIYTCGPTPMMKAIAQYAKEKGIDCEVSLENMMACGIGVCLCCVQDTVFGHKCVCTEGPVFNINDLKW